PSIAALINGNSFNAATLAFVMNDMKSRLISYYLKKITSRSLRKYITADMSTSLKVVNIAALCCASTKRFAIVRRRRDIFSRLAGFVNSCSGALSFLPEPADLLGAGAYLALSY